MALPPASPMIEALSAGVGSCFATAVFMPMHVVKTRMQAQLKRSGASKKDEDGAAATPRAADSEDPYYRNGWHAARCVLKRHGWKGLFQGLGPNLTRSFLFDAMYFMWNGFIKRGYAGWATEGKRQISNLEALACGVMSAWMTQAFAQPIDTISTRVLTQSTGTMAVVRTLYGENGVLGLWRGITASMLLALSPAMQFTLFDSASLWLRQRLSARSQLPASAALAPLTAAQLFLLGMVTKSITMSTIYPLVRAKIRIQSGDGKSGDGGAALLGEFRQIMQYEGVGGLYRGLGAQLGKSVLSTALLLTCKEKINELVLGLFRA